MLDLLKSSSYECPWNFQLLLHHVIPGAFRIETLFEEMTGISLAGTQLRVNVYTMQDHEWNDVKVSLYLISNVYGRISKFLGSDRAQIRLFKR